MSIGNPTFASDNHWGVPLLDIGMQVERLELPLTRWGREARKSRMRGTWHHYTDDAKFRRLWERPTDLSNSGCVATVELNYSVHAQTPRAEVLHHTYRKRYLARLWQDFGIRIIVDLNVASHHAELNLLGVPHGWRAYATRGSVHRLTDLDAELTMAKTNAGRSDVLFVVYGGGAAVERRAQELGVIWIQEEREVTRAVPGDREQSDTVSRTWKAHRQESE